MAHDRQERLRYIKALEESVERKIEELKEMQAAKIKYQHMQGTKDSIYRQQRLIAKIKRDIGVE